MSAARIRSVKLKSGGSVTVLRPPVRGEIAGRLVRHAVMIADKVMPDAAGYAIVAWDVEGHRTSCLALAPNSQFGETMVPAVVHDVLMRRVCDPRED